MNFPDRKAKKKGSNYTVNSDYDKIKKKNVWILTVALVIRRCIDCTIGNHDLFYSDEMSWFNWFGFPYLFIFSREIIAKWMNLKHLSIRTIEQTYFNLWKRHLHWAADNKCGKIDGSHKMSSFQNFAEYFQPLNSLRPYFQLFNRFEANPNSWRGKN